MLIDHIPVLTNEVINMLVKKKNGIYVDCTVGFAGHSSNILKTINSKGFLIGIDLDFYALEKASKKLNKIQNRRFELHHSSYIEFPMILSKYGIDKVDGFLFDLGISSYQVNSGHRGFSYLKDAPLDMRFNDKNNSYTAKKFLHNVSEKKLSDILKIYGELQKSRKIASMIIERRKCKKMETTFDLKQAIIDATGKNSNKIFSKAFQAIRISTNNELDTFKNTLKLVPKYMNKNGRIGIISFHSIEDRIAKHFLKEMAIVDEKDYYKKDIIDYKYSLNVLTKKPIIASDSEIKNNRRSRSAKLRIAEKI